MAAKSAEPLGGKENVSGVSNRAAAAPAPLAPASKPPPPSVPLDQLRTTVSCGLCTGMIAGSLVLTCGHAFCGDCLFNALNAKPACPACQVSLRAIPTRCLALDAVVQSIVKLLPQADADAYAARQEEGRCAANKMNKMLWWLQPSVQLGGDGPAPAPEPAAPQSQLQQHHQSHNQGHNQLPPAARGRRVNSFPGQLPSAMPQHSGGPARHNSMPSMQPPGAPSSHPLGTYFAPGSIPASAMAQQQQNHHHRQGSVGGGMGFGAQGGPQGGRPLQPSMMMQDASALLSQLDAARVSQILLGTTALGPGDFVPQHGGGNGVQQAYGGMPGGMAHGGALHPAAAHLQAAAACGQYYGGPLGASQDDLQQILQQLYLN